MPDDLAPPPIVVHVDDDLVVVDKPGGMPSVPARTRLDPPDVAARLRGEFGPLEAVHRLDRDTSGLLVLARNRPARVALGRAFEAGTVEKTYLAVVAGALPKPDGELALPLAADRDRPPRQRVDLILGRRAMSRWRVLAISGATSLVALEPVTGRSHQLRVHLAWLGCPVLHDPLYGNAVSGGGLALRALRLVLPHPRDGRPLSVEAAWPAGAAWDAFDHRALTLGMPASLTRLRLPDEPVGSDPESVTA